ncbi:hypothetical protein C8R43DRAFT_948907 [Mycena crocata]|nr:hypothetical protein C8R43DRAFT_948907 [Mycena crocata]
MPPVTKHEQLHQDVVKLGLPSDTLTNKSASQVSNHDVTVAGWYLHGSDDKTSTGAVDHGYDPFWNPGTAKCVDQYVADLASAAHSDATYTINKIRLVRTDHMSFNPARKPAEVAIRYQLPGNSLPLPEPSPNTPNMIEASFLKICLHYVDLDNRANAVTLGNPTALQDLIWVRHPPADTTYPKPNLYFDLETPDFAKERAIVSLLRLRQDESNYVSELTVERLVGSALSGIFHVARCDIISGTKLEFPTCLKLSESSAYPDLATLRQSNDNNLLRAVVIIGEGKVRARGMHKKNPKGALSNSPNVRAQIAAALHPTMILLILAHCSDLENKNKISLEDIKSPRPGVRAMFGSECMVYGVYYDEAEIIILAHFPQIVQDKDSGKTSIRFFQVPVTNFILNRGTLLQRWRLVLALFAVQRHAEFLVDKLDKVIGSTYRLTSLEEPKALPR